MINKQTTVDRTSLSSSAICGALALVLVQFVTTGCVATAAKLNSFGELSKAGIAYADAAQAVIAQAAQSSVDANSAGLIVAREDLTRELRVKSLTEQTASLKTQLGLLGDIRRHQALIKEYFSSLGALANAGDADSAIGAAARDTISSLGKLSPRFQAIKVGEAPLADFIGATTPLVVANLRARALERELSTNGAAINHELKTSEGLMAFLADKIRADDADIHGPAEAKAVFAPFVDDLPLPQEWTARRLAFLQRQADLGAVTSAQDAARQLRLALAAAAEGRLTADQLQFLVTALGDLVDVLESIRKSP